VQNGTQEVWTHNVGLLSSNYGIHNSLSRSSYNNGLYVFTRDNKLLSFSYADAGGSTFTIEVEDMGKYIQHQFDRIGFSDDVKVNISPTHIYVIRRDKANDITYIYIYDQYYKFWHRRETSDEILNMYMSDVNIYFGAKLYLIDTNKKVDDDGSEYLQRVHTVINEDNIFSEKVYLYNKLYI
jgi:hypothetical protein